jgi:RHS repeat-associated protein
MALVNAADGKTVANYDYGPFGEVLRATGPMATAKPLRFSSKFQDDETDLLYYGQRYYNASTGRWLNPDPLGDQAFLLVYGNGRNREERERMRISGFGPSYVQSHNDPVDLLDPLGLKWVSSGIRKCTVWDISHWFHGFLEIDGEGWGFYPTGNELWSTGKINPDDSNGAHVKCRVIHVDNCRVDVAKLQQCIRNRIARDRAKPPTYSAVFFNCWDWRDQVWEDCLKAARR